MEYTIHTMDDAPDAARSSLDRVSRKYGFVPNLAATMAQVPELLHAYLEVEEAFRQSALSPTEQEVVALTVSFRNGCRYCMSGHSMLGAMSGLGDADLEALRAGSPLPTRHLEAVRRFTGALLDVRGEVPEETVEAFMEAGFTREQVLAVPLGIAFKTLSNLTHHLQPVPVDEPMAPFAWAPTTHGEGVTRVLVSGWLREGGAEAMGAYQAGAGPIMENHGGRPVLKAKPDTAYAGSRPDVVVLMEFQSPRAAAAAFDDPDYARLIPLRDEAFARLDVTDLGWRSDR